ncbi:MAG: adenylate/guanylate cyclase domain-containing protein [Alphaproteobacteria bacterium]|nr:adenylate/guanylate cyclase domain-containing protein [Alphaproteobacteria bacterium]
MQTRIKPTTGQTGAGTRSHVLASFRDWPFVRRASVALRRIARLGTKGYRPDVQRRLVVMNLISYLIVLTTFGYAIQNYYMGFEKFAPVVYLNLAVFFVALLVPWSHRFSDIAGGLIIIVTEYIALFLFTAFLGNESGLHLQYFVATAAIFVVFGVERWKLIVPMVALAIVLQVLAWDMFPKSAALIDAPDHVLRDLYLQASITTGVLIAATVYYAFSLAEAAKAETDALLRSILPDSIVSRIKANPGRAIADSHENAAILFTDISGFVALAREMGPERIVALLNEIVSEFDALADVHGVEKIKTIGDAYMAAAGIPVPVDDPAVRLARLAIDMQKVIVRIRERHGIELSMRVGLAAGPVMAGIIGTHKFTYDVWGDAVNLAARLENKSNPGSILVCPRCQRELAHAFRLESHGVIDIKGVGEQETWFLIEEHAGGSGVSVPPAYAIH